MPAKIPFTSGKTEGYTHESNGTGWLEDENL